MARTKVPWALLAACAAVAVAVGMGAAARLADPLSTPVVPAEDPYTHMSLVREHLRDGVLDEPDDGATMYPPGLHALLGALHSFTGVSVYHLVLFGATVLGCIGVVGMGALAYRFLGAPAAAIAALAYALAPEAVFRTTMTSPTALDLALLPFTLWALLEVLQGRLRWTLPASMLAAMHLLAHPWVFGILAVAGGALLALLALAPWPADPGRGIGRPTAAGTAIAVAIVGAGVGLALPGCWGACGPGFDHVLPLPLVGSLQEAAPLIVALSLVPLATVLAVQGFRRWRAPKAKPAAAPRPFTPAAPPQPVRFTALPPGSAVAPAFPAPSAKSGPARCLAGLWVPTPAPIQAPPPSPPRPQPSPRPAPARRTWTMPWPVRIATSLLLAGAALALAWHGHVHGFPDHVDLPRNLGVPLLALTLLGLVLLPWAPGPLPTLGAALLAATFPFVVLDPFDSPFWPHRTVVYMGIACCLLAGSAVQAVARGGAWAVHALAARLPTARRWPRTAAALALAPALVVAGVAGGAVAADTPPPYAWYRLYDECADEALRDVAGLVEADPKALVVAGTWQAKLVVAAYTAPAGRVWFDRSFFDDPARQTALVEMASMQSRQLYVVSEPRLHEADPAPDLTFLDRDPWDPVAGWCGGDVVLHRLSPEPRFVAKSQGDDWWVEAVVLTPLPVARAEAQVDGGDWIPLERTAWGTWARSFHVPDGATLRFQAHTSLGTHASEPFPWP